AAGHPPAARPRQHGDRDRAQPRRDQDRRLDRGHGAGRRRRRRHRGRRGHAGGGGGLPGQPHRQVPGARAAAAPAACETPRSRGLRSMRRLLNIFVTGALAALPVAATIAIFVWAARLAAEYLGPYSLVGGTLRSIGLGIGGSEVAAYAIGVLIVLIAIFLLGMLVRTRLRDVALWGVESVVGRIPVVRNVYDTVKKFVDLLSQ